MLKVYFKRHGEGVPQDAVVKQMEQCPNEAGVGVVDLSFQGTSADKLQAVPRAVIQTIKRDLWLPCGGQRIKTDG